MKIEIKKIDNLGYIKFYGSVKNDPERRLQLKNNLEFSQSLTTNALLDQRDSHQAKDVIDMDLQLLAPAA